MECDITIVRLEPCSNAQGGLSQVLFINFEAAPYSGFTFTADEITDGGSISANCFQYDLVGTANTFEESNEGGRETGSIFWLQTGTIVLKKQDKTTTKELKLLAVGRPKILVLEQNGDYRLSGAEFGCDVKVDTTTGGAMGDLNGYNITWTANERSPASYVSGSIVGAGLDFIPVVGT